MQERSVENRLPVLAPTNGHAENLVQQYALENQKLRAEIRYLKLQIRKLELEIRLAKRKIWLDLITTLLSGSGVLYRLLVVIQGFLS